MTKRSTVFVLGAGASYASPATSSRIPLQRGFFAEVAASNFEPVRLVYEWLDTPPTRQWLVAQGYGDPADPDCRLRNDRDLGLEDIYAHAEAERRLPPALHQQLISTLHRVILETISFPIAKIRQDPAKACPLHRQLVLSLKLGDTIINFNYDSLVDDALLHHSKIWHPVTGHGIRFDDIYGGARPEKAAIFKSRVLLLKPHGSITFRYRHRENPPYLQLRFLGLTTGISPLTMGMADGWDPFFVPPSPRKLEFRGYINGILSIATRRFAKASRLIVIGYSFPQADKHALGLFQAFRGRLTVVDPQSETASFRARLAAADLEAHESFPDFASFLDARGKRAF